MTTLRHSLSAAALCLLLAACAKDKDKPAGAGDPAPAPPAPTAVATKGSASGKACSLVTKDDMSQILGATVVSVLGTDATCEYRTTPELAADIDTTWTGGKRAMADAKALSAAVFSPLAGLGDEAYFHGAGVTHVRKGDVYVVINSRLYLDPEEREMKIARKVVASLTR